MGSRPLYVEILHTGMSADFHKIGRQLREHSDKKSVPILEGRQAVEEKHSSTREALKLSRNVSLLCFT